jgi:hypothetical protein
MEQPPFGNPPPKRVQVDSTVFTFQVLDNSHVVVPGTDGNLWLEQGPFAAARTDRWQCAGIPGNRYTENHCTRQGRHALEGAGSVRRRTAQAPACGQLCEAVPSRIQPGQYFVLGTDGNLWLEKGSASNRQQVDSDVRSFRAVGVCAFFWVLGTDGHLWLEVSLFGTVPPQRFLIDSDVLAFQPLDYNDVVVLRNDGTLWLNQGASGVRTRTQIDANVIEFAASDTQNMLVLDSDRKLWWEKAPFRTVPPARTLIDVSVMKTYCNLQGNSFCQVL